MVVCPVCGIENGEGDAFCTGCGADLSLPCDTGKLPADTMLEDRYVIVKTLGRGGMGAVYQALDLRLDNAAVAIKEMSTAALGEGKVEESVEAFKKEARMLSKLDHPSLPRITDFFSVGEERWYLVMEYIPGETLKQIVKRKGPLPQSDVLEWGMQICDILDYLHNQEPPVIFRDLKPSNIMLHRDGRIKLIDFGISRHFKPGMEADTISYGSHGYSPPEQYGDKQTDARSDIYSLGATMHHLLTAIDPKLTPFSFEPVTKYVAVSPAVEAAVMKALSMNPGERPASALEFKQILEAARPKKDDSTELLAAGGAPSADSTLTMAQEPTTQVAAPDASDKGKRAEKAEKPPRKKRKWPILAALLLLVVGGVAGASTMGLLDIPVVNNVVASGVNLITSNDADGGKETATKNNNKDTESSDKQPKASGTATRAKAKPLTSSKKLLTEIYDDFSGTLSNNWDMSTRHRDWVMDKDKGAYAEGGTGFLALNLDKYVTPRNYTIVSTVYYDSKNGGAGVFIKTDRSYKGQTYFGSYPPRIYLGSYGYIVAEGEGLVRTEIREDIPDGFQELRVDVKGGNVDVYLNGVYKFSTALTDECAHYGKILGVTSSNGGYIRSFKLTNNDTVAELSQLLFYETQKMNQDEVKALILADANVDINNCDEYQSTPLMQAASNNDTELVQALIASGANVDAADREGHTALAYAADKGHTEVFKALLDGGANVNLASVEGWTPLMYASKGGYIQIVRLLLGAEADVQAVNAAGDSALSLAVENWHKDVESQLIRAGASKE